MTRDEMVETMLSAWFGPTDWEMWKQRHPESEHCRRDMSHVLSTIEPLYLAYGLRRAATSIDAWVSCCQRCNVDAPCIGCQELEGMAKRLRDTADNYEKYPFGTDPRPLPPGTGAWSRGAEWRASSIDERNSRIRASRQSWTMSETIGRLPPGKYEPVPNPPPTCTDWCTAREASLGIAWDKIVILTEALVEIRDMGPAWNERCCACGWQQIGMLDWKEQQHLPHGCPIGRAIEALEEIE